MNGGYSMINRETMSYSKVAQLYAIGKPVVVHDGKTAETGAIVKQDDSYIITTLTTAYTITASGIKRTSSYASAYNYSADTGVKNFLKQNLTVPTELTVVQNSDGSITVTANTTAIRRLTIATDLTALKNGSEYILSGCTGGNSTTTYHLGITKSNYAGIVYQTNTEVKFTKTEEMALVVLTVQAGQQWEKTFYPMIRDSSITDDTFQAYTPTNSGLYSLIKSLETRVTALEE